MRILNIGGIPTSLGEAINYKYHLDLVKHNYDQILLNFHLPLLEYGLHTNTVDWVIKKQLWEKYLHDIGQLFFSEPPYSLIAGTQTFCGDLNGLIKKIGVTPRKPDLGHLLCKGTSLNLGEDYIVITTKAREVSRKTFFPLSIQLWSILKCLSNKYKIVILGEKLVEMRKEYIMYNNEIFGIYEHIIANIPGDRIVDLTVPALGETVAALKDIQQDCLIMKEAKFTISIGIGGNCCLSCASSGMAIGYRNDNNKLADTIYNKEYSNAVITKDWNRFIKTLERYL
jgi:hypothetical protein